MAFNPFSPAFPNSPDGQPVLDVAVVGAGLAGLVCAQQLQRAGLRVGVIEKSRGLGGRLATRRLQGTCADHGVRYLEPQGALTERLIPLLLHQNVIQPWASFSPIANSRAATPYRSATGLTAVAKWLAKGLEIWTGQRLIALQPAANPTADPTWQLSLLPIAVLAIPTEPVAVQARAVVLAIPAPQAMALVEPLAAQGLETSLLKALRSVEFAPCITAIATYDDALLEPLVNLPAGLSAAAPHIAWLSQEQTKGRAAIPVLVVQSDSAFAEQHLETADLAPVGQQLLEQAAALHPDLASLKQPLDLQVHRWRYALVRRPLTVGCLSASAPAPLACSGDWCGGAQIESALASGLATAQTILKLLGLEQSGPDDSLAQFTQLLHQLEQD